MSHRRRVRATLVTAGALLGACRGQPSPPPTPELPSGSDVAPVLSPQQALSTFRLPPGYRLELVASEPLVQDPVAIDFDADGRMWVAEMRGFMPNLEGTGEDRPVGRIVVLEDTDDDGRMDRSTVFLDSLVLPRSIKVLQHGVLVAETPHLWFARDTDGDLKADTRELVRDDYGTLQSNPEHNANGLVWGIDNWIHNANYAGAFRLRADGGFEYRKTPSLGQWGVSMDEYGRLYRNSNEDPLHVDVVPEHYAARSPGIESVRGVYERLTPNVAVWPVRPTPAVNRGYQPQTLRDDSTLARYTSASSPTAYVGDRLPAELRNNVFVVEPAGNLVGRFLVQEDAEGTFSARSAEERSSFLASTDERFRPVFVSNAPDGTLYVVDMYRGIIQHRVFITGYLEDQIQKRGLEQPVGLGRIYRVVHSSTKRGEKPRLTGRTPAQLVSYLAHPSGWWRITAQQLLVERGDRSVAPALRQMLRASRDERARLHALWTLEGIHEADAATLAGALADASPQVRAAAVRISEPLLRTSDAPMQAALLRLVDDPAPAVRRQLAASLGELPGGAREAALAALVARAGADPVVADLVVSGLEGRELAFLERVLASAGGEGAGQAATVQALAGAVLRSRDAAGVQRLLGWATEEARPRWQRLALLEGMRPPRSAFAGRMPAGAALGPNELAAARAAGMRVAGPSLALPAAPAALLAMAQSPDSALGGTAREVAQVLDWPGKPRPAAPGARPLTAEEQRRFAQGEQLYAGVCAGCHQANGQGMAGVAKSLVGSRWALAPTPQVVRIVLHGKEGEMLMPPVGGTMTDEQVAAVLTYVRRAWGNGAAPVSPAEVAEARGSTTGRKRAWTEEELQSVRR